MGSCLFDFVTIPQTMRLQWLVEVVEGLVKAWRRWRVVGSRESMWIDGESLRNVAAKFHVD